MPSSVLPKQASRRDPSRTSDGYAAAFIAQVHGRPFKPHQRLAADILGEHAADGRYAYPIAVVMLPRQTGKTTLALDLALGRCLTQPDYRAAYCAQTGHVTTERFTDRFTELESGPLSDQLRLRRSQGTERVSMRRRSWLKAFPPKDGALRGFALDLVVVDEAQEHDDQLGRALDQTIMPTFTTRPRRQLLLIGTAGTHRSAYLRRYLELARAGTPGVALIEYGALDDDPLLDERTWHRRHPGLGSGLTDVDALRTALLGMGEAGFIREYLNQWTVSADLVLDPLAWASCRATEPMPAGRPAFGVAVAAGRGSAAIVAAVGSHVELVEICPPYDAAVRVRQLRDRWRPRAIVIDRGSPAGSVADELDRAGIPLAAFTLRDYANACQDLASHVAAGTLAHTPADALDAAVSGAGVRTVGDGMWLWSRTGSAGSIAALEAATLALWGATRIQELRPVVYAG